jgi:nucleotide-binding universal stress UspA family protein
LTEITMTNGIVVGINETAEAREALDWALAEAQSCGVPLTAVFAWHGSKNGDESQWASEIDRRRDIMFELLSAAADRVGSTVPMDAIVGIGSAREALLDATQGADMLVLGRRRLGKLGRIVLGSVSAELVERAELPVTVVRHAGDTAALAAGPCHADHALTPCDVVEAEHRIVVGVDSSPASIQAIRHAAHVAARTGAAVEAIYAWQVATLAPLPGSWGWAPPVDEYEKFAADALTKAIAEALGDSSEIPVERIKKTVLYKAPAAALIEASATAGRIIVGARGLGGFDRLLLGSVSRQVVEYAKCPVTVVR